MIFEWQAGLWQRALDNAGRMPHALLFAGPAGRVSRRDHARCRHRFRRRDRRLGAAMTRTLSADLHQSHCVLGNG